LVTWECVVGIAKCRRVLDAEDMAKMGRNYDERQNICGETFGVFFILHYIAYTSFF
jgi:hypothetical protein